MNRKCKNKNSKLILVNFLLVTFSLTCIQHSYAAEMYGIKFKPVREHDGSPLVLKGIGLKRVFFMKAFVAGFYLKENVSAESAFENVPKRIEVSYFVKVPGKKLSRYTEELIQDNTTREEYQGIEDRVKDMRKYFVDLKPGDRYALTYIPDVGTEFEYNGEVVGTIEGEDFARGLFSTWIGERPMDKRIKKQILGLVASLTEEKLEVALNAK